MCASWAFSVAVPYHPPCRQSIMATFILSFKQGAEPNVEYYLEGKKFCIFLVKISKWQLKSVKSHFKEKVLCARRHGNLGRAPFNSQYLRHRKLSETLLCSIPTTMESFSLGLVPGYHDQHIVLRRNQEKCAQIQ